CASEVGSTGFRPEDATDQRIGLPVVTWPSAVEVVPQRTLDPGAGEHRMLRVYLALDRVVDGANRGAGTHMDGRDSIVKSESSSFKHGFSLFVCRRGTAAWTRRVDKTSQRIT